MKLAGSALFWMSFAMVAITEPSPALSQDYPAKPIHIVVPFPPGGAGDTIARTIGQKLTESWSQPIVVENRPGAGGNIGAGIVAKAAADGYTLLMGYDGTLAINPSLYREVPFDTLRDFAPVTNVAAQPILLAAKASLPVKTTADVIAYAKARSGALNYGSVGMGTVQHLAAELLKSEAKINIVHIPYKGAAPGLAALVAGEVDLMFVGIAAALPHVKNGRIKAIAVIGPKRAIVVPDVPTIAETIPGYQITSWNGILAPAGTPKPIIAKLHGEIAKILQMKDVKERLVGMGFELIVDGPEEFARTVRADVAKWAKVVKESGAKVD